LKPYLWFIQTKEEVNFFMLEALCGNKTIEKILIFLFVNGKCYGTQLHRQLKTALTPIQKGLDRLEKGGVLLSHYEGKTRLYQFNPGYPLINELEPLLKKAYTLLSPDIKKNYYVAKGDSSNISNPQDNKVAILLAFWERLQKVKELSFTAQSKSAEEGWHGRGKGEVAISKEKNSALVFNEKGSWLNKRGDEIAFSNVFRWTLDRCAGVISLEHLRRGMDRPVFIFHLAPTGKNMLSSVDSHLCEGDTYFGQIHFEPNNLRLNWRVIGPKKNEEMDYYYV
jgi:hypothetical protein